MGQKLGRTEGAGSVEVGGGGGRQRAGSGISKRNKTSFAI